MKKAAMSATLFIVVVLIASIILIPLAHSAGTLIFLKQFGNAGTGNGELHLQLSGHITHDNTYIYIYDTYNDRIQKFDSDGNFIAWF